MKICLITRDRRDSSLNIILSTGRCFNLKRMELNFLGTTLTRQEMIECYKEARDKGRIVRRNQISDLEHIGLTNPEKIAEKAVKNYFRDLEEIHQQQLKLKGIK